MLLELLMELKKTKIGRHNADTKIDRERDWKTKRQKDLKTERRNDIRGVGHSRARGMGEGHHIFDVLF